MISLFIALCVLILGKADAAHEELCPINFCNNTVTDGEVEKLCSASETGKMNGRCCISGDTVIGLDLRSCDIKTFNITDNKFINITILDLQDNILEKITKDDLIGFLELNYLYLPPNMLCPGDSHSWENISHSDNRTTCYHQENPCIYLNISCTENGECLHTGPGSAKCECLPGHFGYKCMNEGKFPDTIFFSSVAASTVILCIVFWFTLGRDSYKRI